MSAAQREYRNAIEWLDASGQNITCNEKLRMLEEALCEMETALRDALDDALLIGVSEVQFRAVLTDRLRAVQATVKERRA